MNAPHSAVRALQRVLSIAAVVIACVALPPSDGGAQMTVSGRVFAGERPVQGASVGIPELGIQTRTLADGSYNFLVRAAQVRGQAATLTAQHRQYGSASVRIAISGGSIEHVFDLTRREQPVPAPPPPKDTQPTPRPAPDSVPRPVQRQPRDTAPAPRPTAPPERRVPPPPTRRQTQSIGVPATPSYRLLDSTVMLDVAGPIDVVSALAGRLPGLRVTSAATPGGSSLALFRGPRSLSGSSQPLVVLDGIPVDNTGFTTASQQFGLGGFDYGTPLNDLALDDVATIAMLSGSEAAIRYGSRGGNGVLEITTKRGGGGTVRGLSLSSRLNFTGESAIRLPSYQNQYGQGLGGQFEFFDGRGGGINDAVEQSWGPRLDGQPIIQASLTEPRRPDVRAFAPHPSGVRDYFGGGRTLDASIASQVAGTSGNLRAALHALKVHGLTPGATVQRLGLTMTGVAQPASRLTATGTLHVIGTRAEDRPGTGFNEINPVAGFTRMGRQVDLAALRSRIRDTVDQINWIYTSRNNPFVQSLANSNDDHRGHIVGGGVLAFDAASWLRTSVRVGTDNYHQSRNFQVARGWKGGYPTALGRGDFSGGGGQQDKSSAAERMADLSFDATHLQALGFMVQGTAGMEARRSSYQSTAVVTDSSALTAGPAAVASNFQSGRHNVSSFYLSGTALRGDFLSINAGARMERSSSLPTANGSAVFPSFGIAYDMAKPLSVLRDDLGVGSLIVRASWWRAGNEVTTRSLARAYSGGVAGGAPTLGAPSSGVVGPERTVGSELNVELSPPHDRWGFGFTFYKEISSELLLGALDAASSPLTSQRGEVSNRGYEAQLRAVPMRGVDDRWELVGSVARNHNVVRRLNDGVSAVDLGVPLWGASLIARAGAPLGVIVGTRALRDPSTSQLVLKNGLPLPDPSGLSVLGSMQPDWTASVHNRLKYHGVELAMLVDARMGGEIFSATNLWGSYAGTLSSTLAGRDSGIVVAGLDSVTRTANSTRVSTEDYFHSLALIHEAWVYDASYAKLREARVSYVVPLRFLPGFREQLARVSVVGRNLLTWSKAPNIDAETLLSVGVFQGFEMGQLPSTRSLGIQLSITP